jgi:hypothetical protein
MELDPIWIGIGTVCFGIVVGYITYRTLVRTEKSAVSDIASVIGAIAGATITGIYSGSAFALYSIGLLLGMTIFLLLRLKFGIHGASHASRGSAGGPRSTPPTSTAGDVVGMRRSPQRRRPLVCEEPPMYEIQAHIRRQNERHK